MEKLPTAEEILSIICPSYKEALEISEQDSVMLKGDRVKAAMIRFAKLHLDAQAKAICDKVSLTDFAQEFLQEGADDAIDKDSILNAYPLTNIK
jgi:hypothetical protein